MKSIELMIGDWVSIRGDIECKYPRKVISINEIGDIELSDLDGLTDIYPIPLTTEMLLANGFERNEYFDYNVCIYFSFPTGVVTKRSGFGIEKRDNEYYITDHALMPMRYVHELQHALRLCGFNELANNFKI